MPIETRCPSCSARLRVRDEGAGKQVRCPRCRNSFLAPDGTVEEVPPPGNQRPTVFVSHSHHDRDFVRGTLKPLLEGHGFQVWWAPDSITAGDLWLEKVRGGVHDSDWFLLVMSPQSQQSYWVKQEVEWALSRCRERFLPVRWQKCEPREFHPDVAGMQLVDFTEDQAHAGRRLLTDILQKLHQETRAQADVTTALGRENEQHQQARQEADRRRDDLAKQIQRVLGFDGTYTHTPRRETPPFVPLGEGRPPIIALLNLKGGVGKTTLTANLGAAFWNADPKERVLLVDLDYQANLSLSCLGTATLDRLGRQQRLVQDLFQEDAGVPLVALRSIEQILDDNDKATEGSILACDSRLGVLETQALMRWLVGESRTDLRYVLRTALHSDTIGQAGYQCILLDCPPRLTPTCINALTACDYLIIPVILDEKSTEGPPHLLRWIWERREQLDLHLSGVGILANQTNGRTAKTLVEREKEQWTGVLQHCRDAWPAVLFGFETVVPLFNEGSMQRKFPAAYADLKPTFAALIQEMRGQFPGSGGGGA
jgi:predicted Zn finger-like uncharacterized protein